MTDFERINSPRIEKIVKMLDVIDTSARSNRAHEIDVAKLLLPVQERLNSSVCEDAAKIVAPSQTAHAQRPASKLEASHWPSVKSAVDEMSAQEITSLLHYAALTLDNLMNESRS